VSVGAPVLYVAVDDALYSINVNSAKATLVGNGSSYFGALLYEKKTLYGGGASSPYAVYTVNTKTGADTLVAPLKGEATIFWGLAPAPKGVKGKCPSS